MIPKDKISKATNVKKVHLVYQQISEDLANIDILRYVKIYNGSIKASNFLSDNGKKEPIIKMGDKDIVGVELLVDIPNKTIQFYSITSSVKGYGEKIVSSVVNSVPKDWEVVVVMDWSMGFWQVMVARYPRLTVL
ncbi:MAG: hypothetical protein LUO94_10420 [Methylococcaceae bacterium]|nr:hypothetical protein [Methylococcaceae bacterium]